MSKKLLCLVLAAVMALCVLTACGSTPAAPAATQAPAATEAPAEAPAEEAKIEKIVFATNPEFPPFEFITTNGVMGEYDGIDIAIVQKMGEILDCKVEMQSMEFDSLLIALQNGQIDATIAGMTVTEERAKSVDFSTPYYTATQVMIVKEGSDIKAATDMEGKGIAVVQGYTGETCVSELGYKYEAFKKGTECIMELMNGKCDVVVIDSATAQKYVADNQGLVIVEDEAAFGSEEYAIAVQKGNETLLNAINSAVEAMLADGTISALSAQYIDADTAEEAPAEAAAPAIEKIVFATNPEFPPFEFITTKGVMGEYDGIDIAIVQKMGEILGCKVEMQSMEFDSLLIALQNGQIDATIAGMTVTEERAKSVDFSTPYYTATQVMIVKEGSEIKTASDMEGKVIAVVQGYTGETCVSELGYDYEAFKKGTECVMELMNGKCDVVVIDSATAQKYVSDNQGLVIVEDEAAFGSEEYAIAVQKGNETLLNAINSAVEAMLADGTISALSAQYIDAE